jgi:hypothetical protein
MRARRKLLEESIEQCRRARLADGQPEYLVRRRRRRPCGGLCPRCCLCRPSPLRRRCRWRRQRCSLALLQFQSTFTPRCGNTSSKTSSRYGSTPTSVTGASVKPQARTFAACGKNREDHGRRSPEEVREVREQAAKSATVCADCFEPLANNATVTIHPAHCFHPGNHHSAPAPSPCTVSLAECNRSLHHTERVCCADCRRTMLNAPAREPSTTTRLSARPAGRSGGEVLRGAEALEQA